MPDPATPAPGRRRKNLFFILLPLLVLAADFALFPRLFANRRAAGRFGVESLLARRVLPVGSWHAQRLHVALDDLGKGRAFGYLEGGRTGFVLSHFIGEPEKEGEAGETRSGALGGAVLARLAELSPLDHDRLLDLLGRSGRHAPGEVLHLALQIPERRRPGFPVDDLFVVLLPMNGDVTILDTLPQGCERLMAAADGEGIANLVLPLIGYNWQDDHTLELPAFFDRLFAALATAGTPRDVYVSLYSAWPTFVLEDAVGSLDAAWERHAGRGFTLYRPDSRLALVLLPVCLFACSFRVPLTWRNFLILSVALFGSFLGSAALIEFFTQGFSPLWKSLVRVGVWTALAAGFPYLANWNPKDLLER